MSPFSKSFFLSYKSSSCKNVEYSKFGPSTIASTGQAYWQNPKNIHFVISISYFVVLLEPSGLGSDSITIAKAGQAASQSLQAMHLSSPVGYLLRACSPLNLGLNGPFS